MREEKKKLLIFHQALAPYRVDFWNSLNDLFDLKVYFMYENLLDQKFDQDRLRSMLNFKPEYLNTGVTIGVRAFRWGYTKIIKEFNPDIIFTYEYSQTTISLYLIKKIYGFKYALYSICDDSLHIAQTCGGIRLMIRNYLVDKLDGLILISQNVADWYRSEFGANKKWMVFPILAKEEVFRGNLYKTIPQSKVLMNQFDLIGKKTVFFIGRLMPVKGIDRLIGAFSQLSNLDDVVLVIIGEGDERDSLRSLVKSSGLEDKVIFPGRYEGLELSAWYNLVQVFVLASHYEPFGAVVNEALLSGAYVLCSQNAGSSALIEPGLNGEIFDPYNIQQLSSMLTIALEKVKPLVELNEVAPSNMKVSFDKSINVVYDQLTK